MLHSHSFYAERRNSPPVPPVPYSWINKTNSGCTRFLWAFLVSIIIVCGEIECWILICNKNKIFTFSINSCIRWFLRAWNSDCWFLSRRFFFFSSDRMCFIFYGAFVWNLIGRTLVVQMGRLLYDGPEPLIPEEFGNSRITKAHVKRAPGAHSIAFNGSLWQFRCKTKPAIRVTRQTRAHLTHENVLLKAKELSAARIDEHISLIASHRSLRCTHTHTLTHIPTYLDMLRPMPFPFRRSVRSTQILMYQRKQINCTFSRFQNSEACANWSDAIVN